MAGGAGSDNYVANNTGDVVIEKPAEGTDTVKSSISYTLPDNVENLVATGSAKTTLTGNALANSLTANGAGNVLRGMDGADVLVGGAGADTLEGGAGKENLIGGAGADRLVGGSNQDNFVFKSLSDFSSGRDVIVDLRPADYDRIDLRALDASNQTSGDQAFRFIGSAAFSRSEAELRFEISGSDIVVSGDINGDGVADFSVRVLNLSSISSNCFLL
jgi:Ca2+-binding RTX toxin-like protein